MRMKKSLSVNLILFSLLVGLGVIAWLDPFADQAEQMQPLTSINASDIQKIRLTKSGKDMFRLVKDETSHPEAWQLTHPLNIPANPLKVEQLINLIRTNSLRQYRIKSDNLAKLGLASPAWNIVFTTGTSSISTDKNVDEIIISFGKTEPIGQKRYVLIDDTVHLINDRVSQFNFGSPLMLANLDILPVDKSVKEVHLPDKVIRRVDGEWQSSSPAAKHISQSTYKDFIDEWRYAQALRVALADKTELNTNAQPVTVYLEKAEQPVHFTVETSGQDLIVTNKDWGVRYYLNGNLGEKLLTLNTPSQALESPSQE